MRIPTMVAVAAIGLTVLGTAAVAAVKITVNLRTQTLDATSSSGETYSWPVSTGRPGFGTPRGTFGVQRMEVMHRSHEYHNSAMPHSIFFSGGYAIHGTFDGRHLGQPASHGCVRLSPTNAAQLYSMVQAEGARISIVGSPPAGSQLAGAASPRQHHRMMASNGRRQRHQDSGSVLSYSPVPKLRSFDDWTRDPDLRGQ